MAVGESPTLSLIRRAVGVCPSSRGGHNAPERRYLCTGSWSGKGAYADACENSDLGGGYG